MPKIVVKEKPKGSQNKPLVVVVGKKVSKKATKRNLIKRRVRSIMREFIKRQKKDYTVIVGSGAKNLDFKEMKKEIENQLLN